MIFFSFLVPIYYVLEIDQWLLLLFCSLWSVRHPNGSVGPGDHQLPDRHRRGPLLRHRHQGQVPQPRTQVENLQSHPRHLDLRSVLVNQPSGRLEPVSVGGGSNHLLVWLLDQGRRNHQLHCCHSDLWIRYSCHYYHTCLLQDRGRHDSSSSESIHV